jgi:hypothetical protein
MAHAAEAQAVGRTQHSPLAITTYVPRRMRYRDANPFLEAAA